MSALRRIGYVLAAVGAGAAAYFVATDSLDRLWTIVVVVALSADAFYYFVKGIAPEDAA